MAFSGQAGYAAGAFGTLLETTDGGGSWSGLRTGTATALSRVQIVDPTTVVTSGGCVARRSIDGGATFSRIAFTPVESSCDVGVQDLSFADQQTGWLLLADGSVLQTADGGQTFTPRTAVPQTTAAGGAATGGALLFRTASTGYATTSHGAIYATSDQGQSWTQVASTGIGLDRLTPVGEKRIFATGTGGVLARSSDGGLTWEARSAGANRITGMACASETTCLLATGTSTLLRTTDAATTLPSAITATNDTFNAVGFA